MPKRARIGGVSMPSRVVAPISVNGSIGIVIVCAFGPSRQSDVDLVILHRGIEELFDDRPSRWISSMKRMSPARRFVSVPTRSPGFSSAGPRRGADVHAEFARDQLGERRLAESRRAEEERVVERLAARDRRMNCKCRANPSPSAAR